MVEFGKAPVNKPQLFNLLAKIIQKIYQGHLSILVINHDVVRFHISMHYPFAVAEIESLTPHQRKYNHAHIATYLKELKYIVTDIVIDEFRIEAPEIGIIHVFKYQAGCFALPTYERRLPSESRPSPSNRQEESRQF